MNPLKDLHIADFRFPRNNTFFQQDSWKVFAAGVFVSLVCVLYMLALHYGGLLRPSMPLAARFALLIAPVLVTGVLCLVIGYRLYDKYTRMTRGLFNVIREFEKGNIEYPITIDNRGYFDALGKRIRYLLLNYEMKNRAVSSGPDTRFHQRIMEIMTVLINALEEKDPYTVGHSTRVAHYAVRLGERLRLSAREVKLLNQAAVIHDIGKIGIPINIINKTSELDSVEQQWMLSHPVRGVKILSSIEYLKDIAEIVLYHHENYDGTGYYKARGEAIPRLARIIAIADAYDAMRTDRPYRRALSRARAIRELKNGRGTQFDPALVDSFLKLVKDLD
ncbi:MAG TPA: HD-GYP domain-containing protein [Spirochaetota bacterium]|nr:HD-GYP domain-containing protein [Spirochaetota bacterium]HNT12198.1 HD-GYP domain-containing protein [Spirochaetota bacterium]HOS39553.1 HD-GYP domain-containing protein [Spirochaetota bacterium]HPU90494.1 HD-GYP domain-containing protein [Spirochaetota bacterium]